MKSIIGSASVRLFPITEHLFDGGRPPGETVLQHIYLPRELPKALESLVDLALDLRWSSTRSADRLWRQVEPEMWEQSANGWLLLQNVSEQKLAALAEDGPFLASLQRAVTARENALNGNTWFRTSGARDVRNVAYFSMEFGLSEALPLYSGGLGILAGDYLKSSNDIGLPVTGIGLLYQQGYFRQVLSGDGWQQEVYPFNNPVALPVQPVITDQGWLRVSIDLPGRTLHLRVWLAMVGNVRLYLLDSDEPSNSPADCGLTGALYSGNQEMRIQQEMILGVGGWRALEALGIPVEICHLNEGHAAFLVLERARAFARDHRTTFWQGLWTTRPGNVFTTHTAVEAGFDKFPPELARKYMGAYLEGFHADAPPVEDVLALGRQPGWDSTAPLNMAYLAMRGCGWANGVSHLHGEVSRDLFRNLYPRWPAAEVPVTSVTNGVHVPSWISESVDSQGNSGNAASLRDEELLALRNRERAGVVAFSRARLVRQLGQRGASKEAVAEAAGILQPDVLTLGFARRFADYKRPNLLLRDPERFARILSHAERPVQIIIAGKAHPADEGGKRLIQTWVRWIANYAMRARAVFLEDYDMELAQHLAAGVDVWINTPRRPWEASGTSGMKLLANGGLNLSELDGWWVEAYSPDVGWAIGDMQVHAAGSEDESEAQALYHLLEDEVVPEFYERDETGIPRKWLARVRASMTKLVPLFNCDRMCRQYAERLYAPAAVSLATRTAGGAAFAKELMDWQSKVQSEWPAVRFGETFSREEQGQYVFRAKVFAGPLEPSIRVELFADSGSEKDPLRQPLRQTMTRGDAAGDGFWYETRVPATRPASDFTPRVVAYHEGAILPVEENAILWPG